jgi:hypothetical protein
VLRPGRDYNRLFPLAQREKHLSGWLSDQHSGLKTYKAFRKKSLELAKRDPRNAALYALLATEVDAYIGAFDEAANALQVHRHQ